MFLILNCVYEQLVLEREPFVDVFTNDNNYSSSRLSTLQIRVSLILVRIPVSTKVPSRP